jgi:hypothetical protein
MPRNAVAYDDDFFAWTMQQADLLREGALSEIDVANLAEEIEDMGKSLRRELRNRMVVLLAHLLKWQCQPNHRSRSWSGTAREQRRQINDLLAESASLRPVLAQELAPLYSAARGKAADETGFPETTFPADCPFTLAQILAQDFLPGD